MGTFCKERLDAAKAQIIAYDAAIAALTVGGAQSYTLNTGQSTQTVTKFDILNLQKILESLENKVAVLEARCNGSYRTHGRPVW